MTVKFDLSLNIQILCATIETSRVVEREENETENIYFVPLLMEDLAIK